MCKITHGSSPLARGTFSGFLDWFNGTRLIPARAGNIGGKPLFTSWRTAHPRSRGEHDSLHESAAGGFGSSPLARGTWLPSPYIYTINRLIPARAGNIAPTAGCALLGPAHPRSRGEHDVREAKREHSDGSSPLARGTFQRGSFQILYVRLIPARAGNMQRGASPVLALPAHPRSRGEHSSFSAWLGMGFGSSPLARGTSQHRSQFIIGVRLIPARAGNISTCALAG